MTRQEILNMLHQELASGRHLVGTVAGSGMTARYTAMGGSDLILALSAGRTRIMGRSSFASFLCYGSSNQMVMELGVRELLPLIDRKPIIFGLNACDPMINLYDYLREIKHNGFSGVVNFPTICLIDGQFREALEEEGNTYDREIEAVSLAHYMDLFTIAFAHEEEQARQMVRAGTDIICVHYGFTKGGHLGAKRYLSIEAARDLSDRIFRACDQERGDVIKMVYGGPANTPEDMQYIHDTTTCMGYIGGSTFDRIPTQQAILETTRSFKTPYTKTESVMYSLPRNPEDKSDYIDFVEKYIQQNYAQPDLMLQDLAQLTHVSPSYLSTKFKEKTGLNFTAYLIRHRMDRAAELMGQEGLSLGEIAERVGYADYAQFSKIFKKHLGSSPSIYRKKNISTTSGSRKAGEPT